MKLFIFLALATVTPLALAGCTAAPAAGPIPTSTPIPAPTSTPVPTPPTSTPASLPISWPTDGWPASSPEQQGLDEATLAQIFERIEQEKLKVHSMLIIRHGYLVSETYFENFQADSEHEVFSCTKAVISALLGIAIQQGHIDSIQHKVLDYFPERAIDHNDSRKQAMSLEHLLTMTSGLEGEDGLRSSRDWVQYMLDQPMVAEPGTKFHYNSGNTHLLAAVLQKTTGVDLEEYTRTNLFTPLGITDFTWEKDPSGLNIGGWGIWMTPRDMAKLGYLYLHGGEWNGRQIVPTDWVQKSTRKYIDTGDGRGYGYAWWQLSFGGYSALGYGGQQIIVLPEQDLLVVFTAQSYPPLDEKQLWRLVEDFIIPAQVD